MALITAGTWPLSANTRITTPRSSDQRQLIASFNNLLTDLSTLFAGLAGSSVLTATTLSTGTTNTLAGTACNVTINGVPALIAAQTAQAFGALGTIPASTWGLIGVEVVAAGTYSFTSAAANYTTGYSTEALAIAAIPAISANKCRIGYLTVKASASGWIAGTDGLALGSGGNIATSTNFYNTASLYDTTAFTAKQINNLQGTLETAV